MIPRDCNVINNNNENDEQINTFKFIRRYKIV